MAIAEMQMFTSDCNRLTNNLRDAQQIGFPDSQLYKDWLGFKARFEFVRSLVEDTEKQK